MARVHQQKAAGAVRAFRVSGAEARLAEQRRALVAERRRDRHAAQRFGVAVDLRRRADLRQHRPRHPERVQQLVVPIERAEVHQHRPARVGRVRHVPAGQVPDEPGVDRSEQHLAGLGSLAQARHLVEQPAQLGRREVGREREAALLFEAVLAMSLGELTDEPVGPRVLPGDRVVQGLTGCPVPHDGGLALVRDAEGDEVARLELGRVERLADHLEDVGPDLPRIVLDPAWAREDVVVLLLADGHYARGRVEDEASRRRRSLIDRGDVVSRHGAFTMAEHRSLLTPRGPPLARRKRTRCAARRRAAGAPLDLRSRSLPPRDRDGL